MKKMEVAEERVDSRSGLWLWSMVRVLAIGILSIGFIVISALGSNYEKVGALVALGFVLSNL